MARIFMRVDLPDKLVQDFFQAIRNFDMQHDAKHQGKVNFHMLTEADFPAEKFAKILTEMKDGPDFVYMKKRGAAHGT